MRKALFLLGTLDDADLQWIGDSGRREIVESGAVLIQQGKSNSRVYFVLEGELSVHVSSTGGSREVARLRQGEIVGEMSLLDSRPASATVSVAGSGRVFALEHAAVLKKIARDPGFGARFYRAIALFLANRLDRAQLMGSAASQPRLAAEAESDDLSSELADTLHLSGARFVAFLRRVDAAQGDGHA